MIYLADHRVVPITGLEDDFKYIGQGYLYDIIPIPVVICLVLAVLTYYLLRYTYIGRQIYASGGNVEAARYSGVNVDRRIILAYTISVVCAVIVGMIQAARLGLGHPGTGEGYELLAIAACILGGYSLLGGEGTIPGVIVGAMLIGVLQNEMVILKIDPFTGTRSSSTPSGHRHHDRLCAARFMPIDGHSPVSGSLARTRSRGIACQRP